MREIGTIDREKDAKVLADYLLTFDISTKLVPRADGSWAVWVHEEDRLSEAREILGEFARNPDDARYRAAAPTAKELRKRAEKAESDYRKRVRDLRDRWEGPVYRRAPLTFGLLVASIIATALQHVLHVYPPFFSRLSYSVQVIDPDGFVRDLGLANILRGEVWRLVTPIFPHVNILHLFFNMTALLSFGERIETRKGAWRFVLFVLVTAIASNSAQFAYSGGAFEGMSGVVFAMAGYLWIKGHTHPEDGLSLGDRTTNLMLAWLVLGFLSEHGGSTGMAILPFRMANIAHAAGLASGMAFAAFKF